jgi:hypothetical protein
VPALSPLAAVDMKQGRKMIYPSNSSFTIR